MTDLQKKIIMFVGILFVIVTIILIVPNINLNSSVKSIASEPIDASTTPNNIEEIAKENMKESMAIYKEYGLTYDEESQNLYYNGQLVKKFYDNDLLYTEQKNGIVTVTPIRDKKGNLIGLDAKK